MTYNPNDTALADSGIFGLPFTADNSQIHLIPVPWEVTTSYGDGTSRGPEQILSASHQLDVFDIETGEVYQHGYFMLPIPEDIQNLNDRLKILAKNIVAEIESGAPLGENALELQKKINEGSEKLNTWVYQQSQKVLEQNRIAAVVGGDHSSPFGLIQAVIEKHGHDIGILHFDAHADLREAYQGFENSHASIMYNVMEKLKPSKLIQVGIRDFSPGEHSYILNHSDHIHTFFDRLLKRRLHRGDPWQMICDEIVTLLPAKVYVSFDIDGLSPDLCPNTGTPVAGGLSYDQALTLLATLGESGKKIVGFDLNEVSGSDDGSTEWDGNVGARLLFKMCGWALLSNGFR